MDATTGLEATEESRRGHFVVRLWQAPGWLVVRRGHPHHSPRCGDGLGA